MSSPITTQHMLRPHNSAMGPKKSGAHELSTFADRLRFAIDRRKTNANQIEVKTGAITRQAIGFMLSGQTGKPTWDKLVLLCGYLGVRPEWLAEGDGSMLPAPVLNDEEVALIDHFRHMSQMHKRDLKMMAEHWAEENDETPNGAHPRAPATHRRQ